jgi:hypothetical protein
MSEILSHHKVDEYYREGLKYPAFINTLNEYQQRKVLEVCEAGIRKATDYLFKTMELNLRSPNLERNLEVVREVMMGKQLRLREALYAALNKQKQPVQDFEAVLKVVNVLKEEPKPIKKKSSEAENFRSYINSSLPEDKLNEILEIGVNLKAARLTSFLFALEAEEILKRGFLKKELGKKFNMVIEQFSYERTKQALGQQFDKCEGKDPKRVEEIDKFREVIKSLLKL